jgi:CBS domain-containing protein
VQAFIDYLLGEPGRRHRQFPVVDVDGRLTGVVSIADLARCPVGDHRCTPVQRLARPLPAELALAPDTPLEQVLRRMPIAGGDLAVVVTNDQVVGVLTGSDIAHAMEIGALREGESTPTSTH